MKPVCPYCESKDVHEINLVIVTSGVKAVHIEEPEYTGFSEPDWDSSKIISGRKPYECHNCHKQFSYKQLLKASIAGAPKWLRAWLKLGDDMKCPVCGEEQVETQDMITLCRSCGWQVGNREAA